MATQRMTEAKAPARSSSRAHDAVFAELFREHAPQLWRAVRGLGVREADVEDVCQDVLVIVHRKLAEFEGRSSLRTWIYGIALRVVADYRKKAHRQREQIVAAPPERGLHAPPDASPEDSAAQREALRRLDAALDTLSEERRMVFVLYEVEQLAMREVAELVGCPLQTAYSRLEAARAIVLRELSQEGGAR